MMASLTLTTLPYEVLESIFDKMERHSLVSVCLVSHELYEIASRVLYRSLSFVFGRPFSEPDPLHAFEKRPHLASLVHTITFDTKRIWRADFGRLQQICETVGKFSSIRSIGWIGSNSRGPYDKIGVECLFNLLLAVGPSITELMLPPLFPKDWESKPIDLLSLRCVSLANCTAAIGQAKWYRAIVGKLESLTISAYLVNMDVLQGARALRVLKLEGVGSFTALYPTLCELRCLEHLCMELHAADVESWSLGHVNNPSFARLQCLELIFSSIWSNTSSDPILARLALLVRALTAAAEHLQTVRLSTLRPTVYIQWGESFSGPLVRKYRHSLRVLTLDTMHLSNDTVIWICGQCTSLEEFGFVCENGISDPTMLSASLNLCRSLRTLRLTIPFLFNTKIIATMTQASAHLTRIFVRTANRGAFVSEGRWLYDPELQQPKRSILSRKLEPHEWDQEIWGRKIY